ncbi:IS200/IS605 family transposase [Streptomyces sp. NBC_01236]|uniref:IS200/IS605 family transposase n=1 Tax=Streptomyces sp. NBC_01236 TaxID=2903789 RepID=UPI003FA3B383
MGGMRKIRTGWHCVFVMHVHVVFVTKCRHEVFTDAHLTRVEEIMRSVCAGFACELVEFNGEDNHAHLLVDFPPKIAATRLVNSLKCWSGPYFAGTVGGAPLAVVKRYIEQQNRPV